MRDLLLQCSGVAAIAVALIHGVLGETKVFARATIEPPRLRQLIRLVWQAGTVAWIGGGVLLIAAPYMASGGGVLGAGLTRAWLQNAVDEMGLMAKPGHDEKRVSFKRLERTAKMRNAFWPAFTS
jgi:hypothetical protein